MCPTGTFNEHIPLIHCVEPQSLSESHDLLMSTESTLRGFTLLKMHEIPFEAEVNESELHDYCYVLY